MAKEKVKKSIFKRWWFWVAVVIIVGGVATGGGEEEVATNEKAETAETATTEPKKEAAKSEAGILDEEKFNQIQNGMTYEEVVAIIGADGEVISESGEKGTDLHTIMYEWKAEGGFGANANFMFQGGKLANKAQFGVVESSDVTVTLDEFNQVQNGMTYEEVVTVVGGEGNMLSETGEKGTDFYTIMYDYKGKGDLGANANFTFQGGKLQNKSQFGLK
jgi:outer membrane protein assembly factor BamE (lipoprotein component of BamABCDE complex)